MVSLNKQGMCYFLLVLMSTLGLAGCELKEDDEESTTKKGYIQLYNGSTNAPKLFLKVNDKRSVGINFGHSSKYYHYSPESYDIDISWKKDDNKYESVYSKKHQIDKDTRQLFVVSGNIDKPTTSVFNYKLTSLEDDEKKVVLRFLNIHSFSGGVDLYISKGSETFAEAKFIENYSSAEFSDPKKYDLSSYRFYVTAAGVKKALYQSNPIPLKVSEQAVLVIRENTGPGASKFTIDKLSLTKGVIEYPDKHAGASYRVYNGIDVHEAIASYKGKFDLYIDKIDDTAEISALAQYKFSAKKKLAIGDYKLHLTATSDNKKVLAENHLLTLAANSDKTVFFYSKKIKGNKVSINHIVTNNRTRTSLYDHQINVINFIENPEFKNIKIYFVRSHENTGNAAMKITSFKDKQAKISLLNNTYDINVIARKDDSDVLIATQSLTISKTSGDLYLVLDEEEKANNKYKIIISAQK